MSNYKYSVFIGRFQPVHKAHIEAMKEALSFSDTLLVVLGSSQAARNIKNPFSDTERMTMITDSLLAEGIPINRFTFTSVRDQLYSMNGWISDVKEKVKGEVKDLPFCLIGHHKDDSSFYLDAFPKWNYKELSNIKDNLSSSMVRDALFGMNRVLDELPDTVKEFLYRFKRSDSFSSLVSEYNHIKNYKAGWQNAPYEPTFITTDAVVVQSGYVLLVKRKAQPGKGLWALPGGFLNGNELIYNCIIRELKEETKIKLPMRALHDKLKKIKVFDSPERSLRGRTVTHAGLFLLDDSEDLPKVKGSDDAEVAKWTSLESLNPSVMYEDHYDIIKAMTGGL